MGNPLWQERASSAVNVAPHSQYMGVYDGDHPYLSARASMKAPLCRQNPNSSIGRDVSQFEAPLSLASYIALLELERAGFTSSADCAANWHLS